MMTKPLVLGVVFASAALVGCSTTRAETSMSSRSEPSGAVALQLQVSAGVALERVTFAIRQPTVLPQGRTGVVDVSHSQAIQWIVGGLPAGAGYAVAVSGVLAAPPGVVDGLRCAGTAVFDVIANVTTSIGVAIVCGGGAPDGGNPGSVVVDVATSAARCAAVTSLSASPARADVGSTMWLSGAGLDPSGGSNVSLRWSSDATVGSLSALSGATSAFTCLAPGTEIVTLSAAAGDAEACAASTSTASMTLVCDAACKRVLRPATPNATGLGPVSVAIGDVNGDGKPDLVVANSAFGRPGSVSVLVGQGDGTFRGQVIYASGGNVPSSVAVGDLNGDGNLDLAVTHYNSNNVGVLFGQGGGVFGTPVTYATGSFPSSVAIGDLNGDGRPDLAVADFGSDVVGPDVLLGHGDGTFQTRVAYPTDFGGANSLAVADLNGDGALDLVVPTNSTNAVSVLLGNGNGTFQPHAAYATESSPWSTAIGDLNADGRTDLVVANLNSNNVSVLLGNGDGTFQPEVAYEAGTLPWFVAIADLNGDGIADVAVANNGQNDVGLLLGRGDGTLQPQVSYATGAFPSSLAIGDLNADRKLDLAATNQGGAGSLSVLLGSCAP